MAELTRKNFYDLAEECRAITFELARHEQDRVNIEQCRAFNEWLPQVLAYDRLRADLPGLTPARPLTKWRLLLFVSLGFALLTLLLRDLLGRYGLFFLVAMLTSSGIVAIFVPERLYGTTIALIEAKVLRIVDVLEAMLLAQELDFTEAAFFKAKENLTIAKRELRTQLHQAQRW